MDKILKLNGKNIKDLTEEEKKLFYSMPKYDPEAPINKIIDFYKNNPVGGDSFDSNGFPICYTCGKSIESTVGATAILEDKEGNMVQVSTHLSEECRI